MESNSMFFLSSSVQLSRVHFNKVQNETLFLHHFKLTALAGVCDPLCFPPSNTKSFWELSLTHPASHTHTHSSTHEALLWGLAPSDGSSSSLRGWQLHSCSLPCVYSPRARLVYLSFLIFPPTLGAGHWLSLKGVCLFIYVWQRLCPQGLNSQACHLYTASYF